MPRTFTPRTEGGNSSSARRPLVFALIGRGWRLALGLMLAACAVWAQTGTPTIYTISGRLTDQNGDPIADAFVNLQGPYSETLVTDADGRYSRRLTTRGTYIVAPYKENYVFDPQQQDFEILNASQTVDFVGARAGTNVFIRGRVVDTSGVAVAGLNVRLDTSVEPPQQYVKTDAEGRFQFNDLPSGAEYVVVAEDTEDKYSFAPEWRYYSLLVRNIGDADFVVTRLARSITGSLRNENGSILYPATVQLTGPVTATVDVDGNGTYYFGNLPAGGSYTVRPQRDGYGFTPHEKSFDNLTENVTEADFKGGPLVNLALGRAAEQSSTGWGGVASRAVDGNTDGDWTHNSMSTTFSEPQAWWQVDLGAVGDITSVKVWNRTDCCSDRLKDFYILVSDTPFESQDLAATLNQSGVSDYHTAGQAGRPTTVDVNRAGRYVRVQLAGTNFLSLSEVEVWGEQAAPTTQPTNLSFRRQSTQSSTGWGAVPARALDGNTSGDWADNSVSTTLNDTQAWWEVDLGSVRSIQSVKLWNRTDCCGERLADFYVIVSDAPFTSQDLAATLAQAGVSGYRTTGHAGAQAAVSVGRTGRYVRVQLAGANYLSLAEVQVWGTP